MAQTLPMEPLEEYAFHLSSCEERFSGGKAEGTFNDRVFSNMIGVAYRTVKRWRAGGGQITWNAADKAAIRLGSHPLSVWGDEWKALDPDEWDLTMTPGASETIEAMTQ